MKKKKYSINKKGILRRWITKGKDVRDVTGSPCEQGAEDYIV